MKVKKEDDENSRKRMKKGKWWIKNPANEGKKEDTKQKNGANIQSKEDDE